MEGKDFMTRDEMRQVIRDLAQSQGMYSRLNAEMNEMEREHPDEYDQAWRELEAIGFRDPLSFILYLEN